MLRRPRTRSESNNALASRGMAQPSRPSQSTLLINRSRQDKPSRRIRAFSSSALSSDMITIDAHSVVQARQDRQLLSAASSSALRSASPPATPRNSSAARSALARPRVLMISSPVARKVGHMVAVSFRHPPQPLHCSRLRVKDSSFAANANTGEKGSFISWPAPRRKSASILKRPSGTILPGLSRLLGSNEALISRMTLSSPSPSCWGIYSVRAMPTPCSAASEPLNFLTRAETSFASWRNFLRSSAVCRSRMGRTCSRPEAACP